MAKSDFGDDINFTIQDKDGFARNLTGINVKFLVWSKRAAPFLEQDCIIVNAAAGQCKYNVKETDFVSAGVFYAKVLLRTGSSKNESTERLLVIVQE